MIWWATDERRLSAPARGALTSRENEVAVSAVSVWEVAIKAAAGKLPVAPDIERELDSRGLIPLAITHEHAWAAGALPPHHRDPFDRMLVAQAQLEGMTIVTRDPRISQYQVAVLPA